MHRTPYKHRHPSFVLLISMAGFISLPIFFLLLSSFPPSPAALQSQSDLLRSFCNATRSPARCISTLSASTPSISTPSDAILATISASVAGIPAAQALIESILASSGANPARTAAAGDCLAHLSSSAIRLSAAAAAGSLRDARAWAGAGEAYQYDCWSALRHFNSSRRVSDAMAIVADLAAVTGDALAMISALLLRGPDPSSWSLPRTERDGYWEDGSGDGDALTFPGGVPRNLPPNATVCSGDGGGEPECDHSTIQSAVDAAPDHGSGRFVIRIGAGIFRENVRIPIEKTNVVFLGDGAGRTVVTGTLNVALMPGVTTFGSATVAAEGDGFMAADLTIENAAGAGAHQAVALRSDSDRSVFDSVEISGHQDSLYARSLRQFYRNCRISGTVDFVFGNAAAVFQSCLVEIVPRLGSPEKGGMNAVAAHGRTDPAQATGFVFLGCAVNGSEEYLRLFRRRPAAHRSYLGRPWKEYARTVFVGCSMGEVVRPEGWLPWKGDFALATLYYGEFGNSGAGAGEAAGRVAWSSRIPARHVGAYSVKNSIQGDEWIPLVDDHHQGRVRG